MRSRFAVAISIVLASAGAAGAADVSSGPGAGGAGYMDYALRTEPVIVYDFEPGVIVRTYWEPPYRNHHYFPSTGRKPKVGRLERVTARHPARSEDYVRYWSASSIFGPVLAPGTAGMGAPYGGYAPYGAAGYGAQGYGAPSSSFYGQPQ
jgi:hypothetical protein